MDYEKEVAEALKRVGARGITAWAKSWVAQGVSEDDQLLRARAVANYSLRQALATLLVVDGVAEIHPRQRLRLRRRHLLARYLRARDTWSM